MSERSFETWRSGAGVVAFALGVAILYAVSQPIAHALGVRDDAALRFANVAGNGWTLTAIACAAWLIGRIASARIERAAILVGVSGILTLAIVTLGSFVLADARPREGGAMHFFAANGHGISGHAAAAALLLFPIRDALAGRARIVATVAVIAWAAFIGFSRVALGMHHAWNVALGWGVGFYVSRVVTESARRGVWFAPH
jgi:membrane-associated phospholipid phosphatase